MQHMILIKLAWKLLWRSHRWCYNS